MRKLICLLFFASCLIGCGQSLENIEFNDNNFFRNTDVLSDNRTFNCYINGNLDCFYEFKSLMNFPQINSKINLDSLGLERDDLIWSSVPTFWIDEIYKDTSGAIFTASKQMYDSGYLYKRTYDDILLLELQKDPNNIIANYELIKLRFQGGYIGLAKFQLDRMVRIYPENKEFIRIQKEIEDEFGNELYDETLTWDEMMEMLVLYDE